MKGQMNLKMKPKRVYYRTCNKCENKVENYNGDYKYKVKIRQLRKATIMTQKRVWLCNKCIKELEKELSKK